MRALAPAHDDPRSLLNVAGLTAKTADAYDLSATTTLDFRRRAQLTRLR
jgi:hypothetical protein